MISFIFVSLGILVGIIAFKVRYPHKQTYVLRGLADFAGVHFLGIGGSAKRKREALFACALVEWRDCVVDFDAACAVARHLVVYISCFVMIIT